MNQSSLILCGIGRRVVVMFHVGTPAAGVLQAALAGVFLYSGLRKALPGHGVEPTLRGLGLATSARLVAPAVVVAELATAAGLAVFPDALAPRAAVAALALGFAVAGALSLARGLNIACNCFGAGSERKLGREQLLLLPLWLAACALIQTSPPAWSAQAGVIGLALFVIALIIGEITMAIPVWRSLRHDREAFG